MKDRLKVFIPIFLGGLALDQLTKFWAIVELKGKPSISILGGFFRFIFATNKGAWGSAGANLPEPLRLLFLMIIPAAVLLGLIVYLLKSKDVNKLNLIAYSLIASGGIGNVIDRILYNEVVDMLWFGLRQYQYLQTNVFNIADVWIMIGFFIIIVDMIIEHKKKKAIAH